MKFIAQLRHIEQPGQLELSKVTTATVREHTDIMTQTVQRYFLGLGNVLHHLVTKCSNVTVPLNKKLRSDRHASFPSITHAEKDAVGSLNRQLTNSPILSFPRTMVRYIVDTEASVSQIECVLLSRLENSTLRPFRYW